jgi:hypothetical protein
MDTAQLLLTKNAQTTQVTSAAPWIVGGIVLLVLLWLAFRKST